MTVGEEIARIDNKLNDYGYAELAATEDITFLLNVIKMQQRNNQILDHLEKLLVATIAEGEKAIRECREAIRKE